MTDNFKKYKIITLTLLSYCLCVIFIGDYIPIEFANSTLKNIYYVIIYISFPILFIWTIVNAFKIMHPAIFVTIATIVSVLMLLVVGFCHTMCGTTTELIFKNKNAAGTIVRRSYGCGAWDSDFPIYTFYKVVPMTPLFYIVTKFDTTNIDKSVWVKNTGNQPIDDYYEKAALDKAVFDKAVVDKAN